MNNLSKNLRAFMRRNTLNEQAASRLFGLNQSTINRLIKADSSKPIRNPSQATLKKLADAMEVSVDELLMGDLDSGVAESPALYQSHPAKPDVDRLGVALTAIDKALRDVEIQGRLGTLAEAILFAYEETFSMDNIDDKAQRQLYDKLVASHLGGWDGETQAGTAREGSGKHRETATTRTQAWDRG